VKIAVLQVTATHQHDFSWCWSADGLKGDFFIEGGAKCYITLRTEVSKRSVLSFSCPVSPRVEPDFNDTFFEFVDEIERRIADMLPLAYEVERLMTQIADVRKQHTDKVEDLKKVIGCQIIGVPMTESIGTLRSDLTIINAEVGELRNCSVEKWAEAGHGIAALTKRLDTIESLVVDLATNHQRLTEVVEWEFIGKAKARRSLWQRLIAPIHTSRVKIIGDSVVADHPARYSHFLDAFQRAMESHTGGATDDL
jgi:hypothetical protein